MFSKSLDRKILIVLSLCVAIITAIIIYITNSRLTQEIYAEFITDSKETMSVIASGIKQTMASGKSQLIEKQLLDIKNENRHLELYILDTDQTIIYSSEEKAVRTRIDKYVRNSEITGALVKAFSGESMPDMVFEDGEAANKYFMYARIVHNQAECFRCHGSEKKIIGALVLRKPIDRHYAAITELTSDNIVVSVLGVCAIVFISHLLITRLISRPVRELAAEAASLPQRITDDSITRSPEISRDDEIGDLQRTFRNMAIELYEKNHALHKSNADLANANKELESFSYSVSHDLRAPLRNIDGFSKILVDDFSEALPEKAKHYLKRVRNGTIRMSMLIDDILAFSRIGRTDIEFKKIPCAAIVKSVLGNFTGEIERRNIAVTVGDLPEINCDSTLMQSLFLNLVSNALKFTRNTEKAEITIGFDNFRKLLFVRDNGLGFDMKYHDKIFQIFQRLHLPEEYEGTGIGLSIVKRIAERHHGKVWAESEPGRGATFFIDLPTF